MILRRSLIDHSEAWLTMTIVKWRHADLLIREQKWPLMNVMLNGRFLFSNAKIIMEETIINKRYACYALRVAKRSQTKRKFDICS